MTLRKLFRLIHLRFKDKYEEEEYSSLKLPLVKFAFRIIFLILLVFWMISLVTYYVRGSDPYSHIVLGIVVFGLIMFILHFVLSKYAELFFMANFIVTICLMLVIYNLALSKSSAAVYRFANGAFYQGYIFAILHRLIGYGVARFPSMLILYVVSLTLRLSLFLPTSNSTIAINILLDGIVVIISYKFERGERSLFDTMYKAKKENLKFKNLITNHLPNQMVVFAKDYSKVHYFNNAFYRAFLSKISRLKEIAKPKSNPAVPTEAKDELSSQNSRKTHSSGRAQSVVDKSIAKEALERYIIQKDVIDKHRPLFYTLGLLQQSSPRNSPRNELEDPAPQQQVTLSKFLAAVGGNFKLLQDLNEMSLTVVEVEKDSSNDSIQVVNNTRNEHAINIENVATETGLMIKKENSKENSKGRKDKKGKKNKAHPLDTIPDVNESFKSSERDSTNSLSSSDYPESQRRSYKVKIFPLVWDDVDAMALVMDDVTKQKIIEDLKMADKNKDMVIAMVSHELRTPLNAMLGLIDIAKKHIKDISSLPYLSACKNSGVLMLSLVNSILDINQFKNKKLKLNYDFVSLTDLMNEIIPLFDYNCKIKKLTLGLEMDPKLPKGIATDKNRLSQVLINLLGNAFKFTFKGGVTVRVTNESEKPARVRFHVMDTGIGIKKEDQDKLFRIYGKLEQQDKNVNSQGIGLGLTISNTLAMLLNGPEQKGIQFESEFGKGSCFSFVVQTYSPENQAQETTSTKSGVSGDKVTYSFLNEKKEEVDLVKKLSLYTSNNNDNFSKLITSSGCLEARPLMHYPSSLEAIKDTGSIMKDRNSSGELKPMNLSNEDDLLMTNKQQTPKPLFRPSDSAKIDRYNSNDVAEHKDINQSPPWCLVVDDNPFNLMVASHIMTDRGYKVKNALNGKDAIDTVKEHEESGEAAFKVILMDCQMPVMDGYQATRIIKGMMSAGEVKDSPILALTANNRDDEHEKLCQDVGMSGQVSKPLQIDELERALKNISKMVKV